MVFAQADCGFSECRETTDLEMIWFGKFRPIGQTSTQAFFCIFFTRVLRIDNGLKM